MRPDQPLAACSRPEATDVDVLPSDTSWLFEPTTGVHQLGEVQGRLTKSGASCGEESKEADCSSVHQN
jgi:hypothetical protein